jgi:hypothetical protein
MLWDAGQWFIDTLRSGRKGGWKDVRSACLEDGKKCEHPERYLMWSVFSSYGQNSLFRSLLI